MQKDNEKKPEQYDDIKIVSARTVEDILKARAELKVFGFDKGVIRLSYSLVCLFKGFFIESKQSAPSKKI